MSVLPRSLSRHFSAARDSRVGIAVAVVILVVLPLVLPSYLQSLLLQLLAFGLFAMAFDFMFGYSGVVSFGHSAYFGLGAYTVGLSVFYLGITNFWVLVVLAFLVGALSGLFISAISSQSRDVYFAILTFLWVLVIYTTFFNLAEVTGGDTGLTFDVSRITIVPFLVDISVYASPVPFYYLLVGVSALLLLFLYRIVNSPIGTVLRGVRENPDRMSHLGYNERRIRIGTFTISAGVSGIAGSFLAFSVGYVHPSYMEFILSGEVIVWTMLGGQGSLLWPMFAAIGIRFSENILSDLFSPWPILVGLFFVFVVIYMPEGIGGKIMEYWNR